MFTGTFLESQCCYSRVQN